MFLISDETIKNVWFLYADYITGPTLGFNCFVHNVDSQWGAGPGGDKHPHQATPGRSGAESGGNTERAVERTWNKFRRADLCVMLCNNFIFFDGFDWGRYLVEVFSLHIYYVRLCCNYIVRMSGIFALVCECFFNYAVSSFSV